MGREEELEKIPRRSRDSACCCLIIEYIMHGDSAQHAPLAEEKGNHGGCCDNNLSKYCRLIKTRSKQIVDRRRGYTTLKCTFASNTHSFRQSFRQSVSYSFTHSLAHLICFEACDNKSSLSLSALQFPARIKVKLIERSTRQTIVAKAPIILNRRIRFYFDFQFPFPIPFPL